MNELKINNGTELLSTLTQTIILANSLVHTTHKDSIHSHDPVPHDQSILKQQKLQNLTTLINTADYLNNTTHYF